MVWVCVPLSRPPSLLLTAMASFRTVVEKVWWVFSLLSILPLIVLLSPFPSAGVLELADSRSTGVSPIVAVLGTVTTLLRFCTFIAQYERELILSCLYENSHLKHSSSPPPF